MFSQLKQVVDVVRSAIEGIGKFKDKEERRSAVIDVLKVYFILKDCVDDGENLISDANGDPSGKIKSLDSLDAALTAKKWDKVLKKQGVRLYTLQDYLIGQHHLSVISPALVEKIHEIIGYKMDRVVTLHGIGAGLYFNAILPVNETPEEKAALVEVMAGAEEDGTLDMVKIGKEIEELRFALSQYRLIVERLLSDEELLSLSKTAREQVNCEIRA